MKLNTAECLEAFQIVDQVDKQPGLLSSQFVRLEANGNLKMSLTGLCTGQATCPIEGSSKWEWFIDRRVLSAFLTSTKAKTITLDIQKNIMLWKSGRQKVAATATAPITGYTTWTPPKGAVTLKLTPELRKELATHATYAPTTAAADHLSAVYLCKGYGILASDSFTVATSLDKTCANTFPLPVLLTSMMATNNGAASVLVDKTGAGVLYKNGYVYQPLSANCLTSYPLKKICSVIAGRAVVKPVAGVKAKVFAETLTHLKNYIFGSETDLKVTCEQSVDGQAHMSMEVLQGVAETTMAATFKAPFKLTWAIAKVFPWAEYIASVDPEALISCGRDSDCFIFSASGKPRRLLIVSESV